MIENRIENLMNEAQEVRRIGEFDDLSVSLNPKLDWEFLARFLAQSVYAR